MKKLIESAKAIELPKANVPTMADLAARRKHPTINNQPRVEAKADIKVNQYIRKETVAWNLVKKHNTAGCNSNF